MVWITVITFTFWHLRHKLLDSCSCGLEPLEVTKMKQLKKSELVEKLAVFRVESKLSTNWWQKAHKTHVAAKNDDMPPPPPPAKKQRVD